VIGDGVGNITKENLQIKGGNFKNLVGAFTEGKRLPEFHHHKKTLLARV